MAEKIQEGIQEEDVGFDVVENITSDLHQQTKEAHVYRKFLQCNLQV
jgi:hypothetical protein